MRGLHLLSFTDPEDPRSGPGRQPFPRSESPAFPCVFVILRDSVVKLRRLRLFQLGVQQPLEPVRHPRHVEIQQQANWAAGQMKVREQLRVMDRHEVIY